MANGYAAPRNVLIFLILVPLALFVGYVMSSPTSVMSMGIIFLILGMLAVPLLLRWHHFALILLWNASLKAFFVPGQPAMWMLVAVISFGIALLNRTLFKKSQAVHAPAITWALIGFAIVIIVTAMLRGGIGLRLTGSSTYGGRKYIELLLAMFGYLALTRQGIPKEKAGLYVAAFLLSTIDLVMTNVIYFLGKPFFFLYYFWPLDHAVLQARADWKLGGEGTARWGGIAFACFGPYFYMLARYGIRGIFDLGKPWRLAIFGAIVVVSMLGGFRSVILLFGLIFLIQFWHEGLFRTGYFPAMVLAGVLGFAVVVGVADKLPFAMQRSLTFLPIQLDSAAREDAQASTDWRLRMWQVMLPELPKYVLLGKGYTFDARDMTLATDAYLRGFATDTDFMMLAGDFHNGLLSVYVPFGSFGVIGILWIWGAGFWVLHRNFRYGDPDLKSYNTFLLAYFTALVLFFLGIFGAISSDLYKHLGILGMSVCLNGGVSKPRTRTWKLEQEATDSLEATSGSEAEALPVAGSTAR